MSSPAVSAPQQRFDRYTRWTLYAALPMAPLLSAMILVGAREWTWATLPHLLVVTAATVLGFPMVRATMRLAHRPGAWPWRLVGAFVAVCLAAAVLGGLAAPAEGSAGFDRPTVLFLIPLALLIVAIAPALSWRRAGVLAVGASTLTTVAWILLHGGFGSDDFAAGRWFPAFFSATLVTLGLTWSATLTMWLQRQMAEQAELTEVRSELAVAEERLRFSRDLHDIFGRTLTAVAIKSDLAAELSDLGRATQASAQMREVHHVAEDALREVRAVVGGYRTIDLAAELRGARALLMAVGIRTRIIGDGTGLPKPVATALAWVVREAATNVVHHSRASEATITLGRDSDAVTLTLANDGVQSSDRTEETPRRTGSGLSGLGDRLAASGGTLTSTTERDKFILTVRIPLEAP